MADTRSIIGSKLERKKGDSRKAILIAQKVINFILKSRWKNM